MYNYLRELFRTFFNEPACEDLEHKIAACQKALSTQLDQSGRKELLRLTDFENELSDRLMFEAFLCGFRLAGGIAAELSQNPPFSFDEAEEQRICQYTGDNSSFFPHHFSPKGVL